MKKFLLVCGIALSLVWASTEAKAGTYTVDDAAVEAAFDQGLTVASPQYMMNLMNGVDEPEAVFADDPQPVVAFLLAWFLGPLGIHRVYLGAGGKQIVLYIVTCGGIFGIVPLIDWIVLLMGVINDDISEYVGNNKFFMWAN